MVLQAGQCLDVRRWQQVRPRRQQLADLHECRAAPLQVAGQPLGVLDRVVVDRVADRGHRLDVVGDVRRPVALEQPQQVRVPADALQP